MTRRMILGSLAIVAATAISGSVAAMDSSPAGRRAGELGERAAIQWSMRPLAAGRIVAIDDKASRITIEHMPVAELFMERMTRVFRVADPDSLYGHSPGDKIRFSVERDGRSYVITRIENSN